MKKLLTFTVISLSALAAQAQTNLPSFFDTAESYLTSFNPAYSWTNVTIEASTGLKQLTGSGATDVVNAQYDVGSFGLGASVGFEGIGSTVGTLQLITGYNILRYEDTEISVTVESGYSWYKSTEVVEPELAIQKKLTANTFARIGVSLPVYFKGSFNRNPTFEAGAGFTF